MQQRATINKAKPASSGHHHHERITAAVSHTSSSTKQIYLQNDGDIIMIAKESNGALKRQMEKLVRIRG